MEIGGFCPGISCSGNHQTFPYDGTMSVATIDEFHFICLFGIEYIFHSVQGNALDSTAVLRGLELYNHYQIVKAYEE